ncbi:hypothetical protein B0J14DRAFT_287798 [Halenospora varia]|nr:hypothetical protein B0J14DRAFT_287798 [Halenospora varia]
MKWVILFCRRRYSSLCVWWLRHAANDHVYIRLGFSSVMRTEMGSWYKALDVKSNRITPNDGLDERIYMRFDALDTIVKLRLNLSFPLLGSICDILWDSFCSPCTGNVFLSRYSAVSPFIEWP